MLSCAGVGGCVQLQIAEISVNKQLENVQKATFDDMFGYDAAVKSMDEDNMELAAAVWKYVTPICWRACAALSRRWWLHRFDALAPMLQGCLP
ncbi:MAG: hypothetical protein EOO41_01835 [Methanobacteriota archaeon]|nr:MAG: hypothetical protein EOO41_01835 [Euryarchaeota archaeon]